MNKKKKCLFCKSEQNNDNLIISSIDERGICEACLRACSAISEELRTYPELYKDKVPFNKPTKAKSKNKTELHPKDFKKKLDEFVIGQDDAKKTLSVAVSNHLKRIRSNSLIPKANVLMIGSSGTGKTYLAEVLSSYINIPMVTIDTTTLTSSGYSGEDIDSIIKSLWKKAGQSVENTEKGIIFLDEIDKNASSVGGTNDKDVSGKAVQQELLRILEGNIVKIYPDSKQGNKGNYIEINTKNILFIAGGAFPNLKPKEYKKVGFNAVNKTNIPRIEKKDINKYLEMYGIIPEFLGRFSNIVTLNDLTQKDLERIIKEPKDSITDRYTSLLKEYSINAKFTPSYIKKIANDAMDLNIGARGLSSIMEDSLRDMIFDSHKYQNKKVTVGVSKNKIVYDIKA